MYTLPIHQGRIFLKWPDFVQIPYLNNSIEPGDHFKAERKGGLRHIIPPITCQRWVQT